jgi:hypothetical protein
MAYLRIEYHSNSYELDDEQLDYTADLTPQEARKFAVDADFLGVEMSRVSVVFDEDAVEVIWEDA